MENQDFKQEEEELGQEIEKECSPLVEDENEEDDIISNDAFVWFKQDSPDASEDDEFDLPQQPIHRSHTSSLVRKFKHLSIRELQGGEEKPSIANRISARISSRFQPANRFEKEIVFIRHGQSKGQLASKKDRLVLESLIDADLSEKGKWQAENLASKINSNDPEILVVVSPLTRALHTAHILFPGNTSFLIHPGFAELNNPGHSIPENTGRSLSELLQTEHLQDMLTDPRVDVSRILNKEDWPAPEGVRGREHAEEMMHFLLGLPAQKIVVVTHHHFIYHMFPSHFLKALRRRSHSAPPQVRNCFPIHAVVNDTPKIQVSSEPHAWFAI